MKKYSIIVPIYRTENLLLRRCIDSLIGQTYRNMEIILVDDGSTIEDARICDEYANKDKRVVVTHKDNGGVSSARNTGLKRATGDFVIFVDADDWLEPTCLAEIEKHNEFDMIIFPPRKRYQSKSKKVSFFSGNRSFDLSVESEKFEIYTMEILGSACMRAYNTKVISVMFDEDLKNGEDVFFNFCNIKNVKTVYYIDQQLYNYDIHKDSAVRNNNPDIVLEYTKTISKMTDTDADLSSLKYSFSAIALLMLAIHYCFSSDKRYYTGKRDMKKVLNMSVYKDLFKNMEKVKLPLTRKISVFFCKYHFYPLIYLVSMIKHRIDR